MVLHPASPQLTDLELLLSVNRLGSFGKAAREHGVSQPAVSVRIQTMERRLGLRLLERSTTGSQFTPAGAALAKWAQTAIDAVSQLMACSAALNGEGSGLLRISGCLTMTEFLIPRWVTGLRTQFPELDVSIRAECLHTVIENVRAGKVDLGFVSDSDRYPDLHHCVVGRDELIVVVSPEHPWANLQRPLSPSELTAGRLVLREKGFGTRDTLRQALGHLWQNNAHLELPSTAAIKEAVEMGAGAGVLSLLSTARDLREGRLVRVHVEGLTLTRSLRAVWGKASELSPAAKALLEFAIRERPGGVGPTRLVGRGQQQSFGDVRSIVKKQRPVTMPTASAS